MSNNTLLRRDKILLILSAVSAGCGEVLFVYLWKEIGDHGIYADETRTNGAFTGYEIAFILLLILLVTTSSICFFLMKKGNTVYKKRYLYCVLAGALAIFITCIVISLSVS